MSQGSGQGVPDSAPKKKGRKSVPWKRDPVILARLPEVERRHLAGQSSMAIAQVLDVDEGTVRNDLKRLAEVWLDQTKADQAALRARALAELEDVRIRALQAAEWDQMCEAAVLFDGRPPSGSAFSTTDEDEEEEVSDAETTFRGRRGSKVHRDAKGSAQFRGNKAASLAQARQATMDKAKLQGLVVDKAALTDTNGDDIPLAELMERFSRRQGQAAETPEGEG
jgi:hypothetical protein